MSTQHDQQKGPNAKMCKKMQKKKKKISNIEIFFLARHFTKFIFLEQLTAMHQVNMQNMFFFLFSKQYHDTNPSLHLYNFRKKYKYILANINSESSRGGGVVRGFKMFCQRGSDFFTCFVCVCVCGGGVSFSTSPSVKKITDPRPINK